MAAERNRKHILVLQPPKTEPYSRHPRGGGGKKPPPPTSRAAHAEALRTSLLATEAAGKSRRAEAGPKVHGAMPGLYIEFDSQPGFELNHGSLTNVSSEIELVAVSEVEIDASVAGANWLQRGTVFVPDGQLKHFLQRLEKYALETPKKPGERRHEDMFDRIASLRLATLRALWTDSPEDYPADKSSIWWEVWLRRQDGRELERLLEFASLAEIQVGDRRLEFDDRIVTLVIAPHSSYHNRSTCSTTSLRYERRKRQLRSLSISLRESRWNGWTISAIEPNPLQMMLRPFVYSIQA